MAPREAHVLRPRACGKTKGIPITEELFSLCKHHSKAKKNSRTTGEKSLKPEYTGKRKQFICIRLSRGVVRGTFREKEGRGNVFPGHAPFQRTRWSLLTTLHETMRRRLQRTGQPHIQDAAYKKKHVSPSNWTEISFSERKVNRPKMVPNSFF